MYFDREFYNFIDYFNKNYDLENYSEVYNKYFEQFPVQEEYFKKKL
jgi:hypothetical protein